MAVLFLCGLYTLTVRAEEDDGSVSDSGTPAIVLIRFDEEPNYLLDAVAFAVGTSQEDLADRLACKNYRFTGDDAEGNSYGLVSGEWCMENVNTGQYGVYYAYATPELGDGYVLGKDVALPKQLYAVSIQTPRKPRSELLLCRYGIWDRGFSVGAFRGAGGTVGEL